MNQGGGLQNEPEGRLPNEANAAANSLGSIGCGNGSKPFCAVRRARVPILPAPIILYRAWYGILGLEFGKPLRVREKESSQPGETGGNQETRSLSPVKIPIKIRG